MIVKISNIKKRFKNIEISPPNFTVNKGEFLGLFGESGTGKTTIGKIILGLFTPDKGTVKIAGEDITKFSNRQRDRHRKKVGISMVFQHPDASLNPGMTVKRSMQEIKKNVGFNEIEKYFDEMNLSREKLYMYPYQLSGGEMRRIALIQALAINPKILIADELFTGVDSLVRNSMANLLKKKQEEEKLTLILISHHKDILAYLCSTNIEIKRSC